MSGGIDPVMLAAFAAAAFVALAGVLIANSLTNPNRRRFKARLERAAGQVTRRAPDTGVQYASVRRDASTEHEDVEDGLPVRHRDAPPARLRGAAQLL